MKIKKYLPIIGISIFVYLLLKINVINILEEIKKVKLVFILIALLGVIVLILTQTLKWFIIARQQKIILPFKKAVKINLISNFYGFITPSKIGVITRAEYLRKYTGNLGKGLCNFTLDKILDLCSILFITILFGAWVLLLIREEIGISVLIYSGVILIIILILMLIFLNKERARKILRFFYRYLIPERIKEKAKLTFDSFYEDIPKKRYFILFFLLNLLNWVMAFSIAFFIGKSLEINLPFLYFLGILPIGTLISMIPISINGIGPREAILISLFSLFDISAAKVFSMSLISLFITGVIPSLISGFLIFKKDI